MFNIADSWDKDARTLTGPTDLNLEVHVVDIPRNYLHRTVWYCVEPYGVTAAGDDWRVKGELRFYLNAEVVVAIPIFQSSHEGIDTTGTVGTAINPVGNGGEQPALRIQDSDRAALPAFKFYADAPPHNYRIACDRIALFIKWAHSSTSNTAFRWGLRCLSQT